MRINPRYNGRDKMRKLSEEGIKALKLILQQSKTGNTEKKNYQIISQLVQITGASDERN